MRGELSCITSPHAGFHVIGVCYGEPMTTTSQRLRTGLTNTDVLAIERLIVQKGDAGKAYGALARLYDTALVDEAGLTISGEQLQALEWYVRAAVLHPDDFAIPVVRGKLAVALDDHGLTPLP